MHKVNVDTETGKMTFWDWTVPGIKVIICLDSGRIEIESNVQVSPETITEVFIPLLQEAAKIAKALD